MLEEDDGPAALSCVFFQVFGQEIQAVLRVSPGTVEPLPPAVDDVVSGRAGEKV
jgi:hypothetical protein